MMRLSLRFYIAIFVAVHVDARTNTTTDTSHQILEDTFIPPSVFENVNLVRTINLERVYTRETINVVIRNVGKEPASEYYIPFTRDVISRVGGLEVKDKQKADFPPFKVETVSVDTTSITQFYKISLPLALEVQEEQTLAISFHTIASLQPLPSKIGQTDSQYLKYDFSAYFPSTYPTLKQKTKLRLPTENVPDYTTISSDSKDGILSENAKDPVKSGTSFTYGPFGKVPAGAVEYVSVRYELTKPLTHATLMERDVEVSHWGGNLAMEERYWLENRAAALKGQFSRVTWQQAAYYSPATVALKNLWVPLASGSRDAYFVDDIGNVSTSRFQSGNGQDKMAMLDLKPRYPLFGGWKYKFKIGWNRDLSKALRRLKNGSYVLNIPFIEGPKEKDGIEYQKVILRVILPEGATNVKHYTPVTLLEEPTIAIRKTFLDTTGRTMVTFVASNVVDEARNSEVILIYDYPHLAMLRKPLTILSSIFTIFLLAWCLGHVDLRIITPGNRK